MAKRPRDILYGVDDPAPAGVVLLSALQQVGLMSINLVYPVLIGRAAGASPDAVANLVALTMIVVGVGAVLQALPRGPVGSGYLCPPVPTAVYLAPSLLAARRGGLPLVFGMTLFAGLAEIALARALRSLRPLFPPEVAGLVVALIGLTSGAVGVRVLLGDGHPAPPAAAHFAVAALTLGTMVALTVWTRGAFRLFCVLVGMVLGYAATAALEGFPPDAVRSLAAAPLLDPPDLTHGGWSVDVTLAGAFLASALAASLKVIGNVTTCQRLNDAEWVRPDMASISRGVLADGLATAAAGALGAVGVNSATMCVGLANATGVLSRRVSHAVGVLFIGLAFFPKLGTALSLMPPAVAGTALLFAASFILVSGLEIMTSRLLDLRRTLVVGLAFTAGLVGEIYGSVLRDLPDAVRAFLGGSLVLGALAGLLLNLVFRLGVRRTEMLIVDPAAVDARAVEDFMERQGAAWGARRDVIDRARFNLAQSVETIVDGCAPQGPLEIAASFDEFNVELRVSYAGAPLPLPAARPDNAEIMASEDGHRRLAGFLLRRLADRVQSSHRNGRATVSFHFDH